MAARDMRGRYFKTKLRGKRKPRGISKVVIDLNYAGSYTCTGQDCQIPECKSDFHLDLPKCVDCTGWKSGRRIMELGHLLFNLRHCAECKLGPVGLTFDSVVGEFRKGLSGYLYVRCQNAHCLHVNRVPYGKTHHVKKKGMPCFSANIKLAMIDSLDGAVKVNQSATEALEETRYESG